jgi:hypothetical protein
MREGPADKSPEPDDSGEGAATAPANEDASKEASSRPSDRRRRARLTRLIIPALICLALVATFFYFRSNPRSLTRLKKRAENAGVFLTGKPTPTPDPYAQAVLKAEEDRSEPMGRQAEIKIPDELKQYSAPRRFLAIQKASATEAGIRSPHDFAELAGMISAGREFVEMPKLGRGYALYGVGFSATGGITHYESKLGKSVPLFADEAELKTELDSLAAERARLETELKDLGASLSKLGRKEKEERARLLSDIAARKKALAGTKSKQSLLTSSYGTSKRKSALFTERGLLAGLARDFGGRAYDLRDAASAKEFETRLLTFIRPAALSVVEELGAAYEAKFERPLLITSLVRTEEYQRLLRETGNPNAADVAPPPHTTGLAFDVFYRFMTAAEQEFVMEEIARLEKDGKVEALRELRDHYHVFVFPEGRRPDEKAVEKVLKGEPKKKK